MYRLQQLNLRTVCTRIMKKPKFNQLRGTYAHPLRHRICLGLTFFALVIGAATNSGLIAFLPRPGMALQKFLGEHIRFKKNRETFFIKIEDVPEL